MKLEITKYVQTKEVIEIEFPYYFQHDLMLDEDNCIIYGKIEESKCTKITIHDRFRDYSHEYTLEIEEVNAARFASYMVEKHKSCEREFIEARDEMLAAIQSV